MAGKSHTLSKKTVIAIVSIIVLLFIVGLSVGIFLADEGTTEAVDRNTTTQTEQDNPNEEIFDGNENPQEPTENPDSESENIDGEDENKVTTDAGENNNNDRENAVGTANREDAEITTGTNLNEVGETTVTRVEEKDKLVSKEYWDWWTPVNIAVASTTPDIKAENPKIEVSKQVIKTETGDLNLTYVNQKITYEIKVTNNSENDVENIEVTDKIPVDTTFESIEDNGKTVKTIVGGEEKVVGVKWLVSIPGHKEDEEPNFVTVKFTVKVNEQKEVENEETGDQELVDVSGTILNKAVANGEESNETRTSIIKNHKSSIITRDNQTVETAKIGDIVTYTITVTNTGTESGKVNISDNAPKGTTITWAEDIELSEGQTKVEWNSIELEAGTEITKSFQVRVDEIDKEIKNSALVSDEKTNEDIIKTADIKIEKTVTNIKRGNEDLGPDVEAIDGDIIEYSIIVTNTGSVDLTEVVVTDILPGIKVDEKDLIIGDLASGEFKEITSASYQVDYDIDIKGKADKKVRNDVNVIGKTVVEPNPENPEETPEQETVTDDDYVITPIKEFPAIDIKKDVTSVKKSGEKNFKPVTDKTTVRPGDIIEFTINVQNVGNTELTEIVITDSLKVNTVDGVTKNPGETIYTIQSLAAGETVETPIKVYYTVLEEDLTDNVDKIYNIAYAKPQECEQVWDPAEIEENPNTDVKINKIWNDENNKDGLRQKITIRLFADGKEVKDKVVNELIDGEYIFKDLPKYNDEKQPITYTVKEDALANYETTYSEDTLTITNTHTPAVIDVPVVKKWENDTEATRTTIIAQLLADGKPVEEKVLELNSSNKWSGTFYGMPKNKYGTTTAIKYTVREEVVPAGYAVNVTGTTITNIYLKPEKQVDKAEAQVGEILTYTVKLKNNGTKDLTKVSLTDTVDTSKLEIVDKGGATLKEDGKTLEWIVDIKKGKTITKTFTARVKDVDLGTVIKNQAEVNGSLSNEVETVIIKKMTSKAINYTGKNIVVVLDLSSSMLKFGTENEYRYEDDYPTNYVDKLNDASGTKLAKAKVALNKFIGDVLDENPNNTITLITFNYDTKANAEKSIKQCANSYESNENDWPIKSLKYKTQISKYMGTHSFETTSSKSKLQGIVNDIKITKPLLTNVVAALEETKSEVNRLKKADPKKNVEVVFIGDGKPSYTSEAGGEDCGFFDRDTTFSKISTLSTAIKKKANVYTVEYGVPSKEVTDANKTFNYIATNSKQRYTATDSDLSTQLAAIGEALKEETTTYPKTDLTGNATIKLPSGTSLYASEKTPVKLIYYKSGKKQTKTFISEAEITKFFNETGIIKYDNGKKQFIINGNKVDRHKDKTVSLTYYYIKN